MLLLDVVVLYQSVHEYKDRSSITMTINVILTFADTVVSVVLVAVSYVATLPLLYVLLLFIIAHLPPELFFPFIKSYYSIPTYRPILIISNYFFLS